MQDLEGWEGTGRTDEVGKASYGGSRVSRHMAMENLVRVVEVLKSCSYKSGLDSGIECLE